MLYIGLLGLPNCVCYQAAGCVGHFIDAVMVLLVIWANDTVVDDQRAVVVVRQEAPYYEDALYEPIHREPSDDDVREILDHGETSVHNPIGQPFSIVVLHWRFERPHRHIRRVDEPNRITNQFTSKPED